jgi:AcrR family transcriptional regulator
MEEQRISVEPRQRILEAALDLFSEKGFSATGMRQIAKQADVNLAMINYYYGSKVKLLEAIIETALGKYEQMVQQCLLPDDDLTLEDRIRAYFREVVKLVRANYKLFRVTWTELHFDQPEISEFAATFLRERVLPKVVLFVMQQGSRMNPGLRPEMVGPTLPGLVASHFLIAPVYTRVTGLRLDDAFYEEFSEQLANMALYGLVGQRPEAKEGSP